MLLGLLASRELEVPRPEVLSWKTADGAQVDVVIEAGKRLLPIEAKTSPRALPGLETFLDEYSDRSDCGLLLYGGEEGFPVTRRVVAAPSWRVV